MAFEFIKLDVADDIATLTFNQPESRNGLTGGMQLEVIAALDQLIERKDVRALIITGAGRSFCAGAALDKMGATETDLSIGQLTAKAMEKISNPLIMALQNCPVPVVSAINGAAAGAGIGIALAADIVIAARSAFFVSTFLPRLGIVPDMGASWFLPQHLGRARAMGVMLLGDRLTAEQALEWGLIWACVDDNQLMEEARKIAARLARVPAHAALEARHILDAAGSQGLVAQLEYEKNRQGDLIDLPSFGEGVKAFFEKREPVFKR